MAKSGKGKKAKVPKIIDPLPGPELLHPVLTYSEDSVAAVCDAFSQVHPSLNAFEAPPVDDDSDPAVSLPDLVPPEYIFCFEDRQNIDELSALEQAEEYSDGAASGSSFTDQEDVAAVWSVPLKQKQKPKPAEDEETDDSGNTASEVTGSGTDLEGYDVADLAEFSSSSGSDTDRSEPRSADEPTDEDAVNKKKLIGKSKVVRKTVNTGEPMTTATAEWVTRKFAELFSARFELRQVPLYTVVEDLLQSNLDFASISPEFLDRLREIAETTPSASRSGHSRSGKNERSVSSSSTDSKPKPVVVSSKPPVSSGQKKSRAPSRKDKKTANKPKEVVLVPVKKPVAKYPAEAYEEGQRSRPPAKPWIERDELHVTNDEQDAWVTESCEDLTFIEYRRERILQGKKVPIRKKDFELDIIAGRLAGKLLAYEAAVNAALPDAEWRVNEERPFEQSQVLPPKPLVPIGTNPMEDPDDEDTTSEEDEPKGGKAGASGKAPASPAADPYHISLPVHEDDKYDYYNSDRSSSDCESVGKVLRKVIEKKLRPTGISRPTVELLQIGGHPFNPSLPLKDKDLNTLPVDDLYALAHDLEMPLSELRKELQRSDEELDYDADSDEDGWRFVRGTFLYEKTPAFYAVQINDLEQQIRLRREQWIWLELDYNEFTVRDRIEYAALDEFILYLVQQRQKEKEKVAELQSALAKLKDEAWQKTEYENWWTNWLDEEKKKTIDRYGARKEHVQERLLAFREYIEKQKQMEAHLYSLRRRHKKAHAAYTQKVSEMLLTSARKKSQLFLDYEGRIAIVFKEYQRALVFSMNDNLQKACSDHVVWRREAKHFSDRAITTIAGFNRANDTLATAQEKVTMRRDLLVLSMQYGDRAERRLARVEDIRDYEMRKVDRLTESQRCQQRIRASITRTNRTRLENVHLAKLVDGLSQEKEKLVTHLDAEQSVNRQIDSYLAKLVTTINGYLRYLNAEEKDAASLWQLESFEDRFIRYLHYAEEIESLVGKKQNRKLLFLEQGDLGFVLKPPHRR